MYTLVRGFCRQIAKKDEYSILILGLDQAVGRIALEGIVIKFWDLGGQTELQSLWDKYYVESHGVIFLIDSSDPDRFDESKEVFDKMIQRHSLDGVPLLIIANKQDLDHAFPVSEVKQVFQDSAHLIGPRECSMRGASALKGDGVMEAIRWMAEKIKKNSNQRPPIAD
ncbi:hypothetical protein Aperf_G00000130495 [Anoplocephala perfoliata]